MASSEVSDTAELQDGALINPRFAFGMTGQGQYAMTYLDGGKLVYPVGVHLALYSSHQEEMTLLPMADNVARALSVVLSSNRKYCAVVEEWEGSSRQDVSVYSLATSKRVKALPIEPGMTGGCTAIQSLNFRWEEPAWTLELLVGKGRRHAGYSFALQLLAQPKYAAGQAASSSAGGGGVQVVVTLPHDWPVLDSRFSPVDDTLLVTLGPSLVSLYKLDGETGGCRTMVVATLDDGLGAFSCVAWLMGNLLALGRESGHLQVNQDAEVKGLLLPDPEDSLTTLVARGRGLVAGGRKGRLYFYDPPDASLRKSGSKEVFLLTRTLDAHIPGRAISALAVSSGEDGLALCTSNNELLLLSLSSVLEREEKQLDTVLGKGFGLLDDQEHDPFRLACAGIGCGKLVCMDAISYLPYLAVVTHDRVVRILNYQTRQTVVVKQLMDDVQCCALHPSGSMLLLGSHDKLRSYCVAQDELQVLAEWSVKKCHIVRFSPGGAFFAAVGRTNAISVCYSFTSRQHCLLKGHVSAVTDLVFSPDDHLLCSTGAGGAVYFWDLHTGSRLSDVEHVDKMSIFTCASFAGVNSRKGAVVRTHDGRLLHVLGGKVEFEVPGPKASDSPCIAIIGEDRVLLSTNDKGAVLSYPWPGSFPAPPGMDKFISCKPTRLHSTAHTITHMVVHAESGRLFTASSDGVVMMSSLSLVLRGELMEAEGAALAAPNTVCIATDRLRNVNAKLVDVAALLGSTKSDAEYAAFRQAQALREALARTESELASAREALVRKDAELASWRQDASGKEQLIVKELENAHMASIDELEALFDRRMEVEAEKLCHAQAQSQDMQFKLEEAMRRQREQHKLEIERQATEHLQQLNTLKAQLAEEAIMRQQDDMLHDEYALQAEVDFEEASDRMANTMGKAMAEAESRENRLKTDLSIMKRANLRLKGEKAMDTKKADRLIKDNTTLKDQVADLQLTIEKLHNEVKERALVMAESHALLATLRRKVADLEKHKFVLEHKTEALVAELQPRKAEVRQLAGAIEGQQTELLHTVDKVGKLTRVIEEKESFIRSLKSELNTAKLRVMHQEGLLRIFSSDVAQVFNASELPGSAPGPYPGQRSAKQKGLEELYHKYCSNGGVMPKSNQQVEEELTRHLHMSELRTALAHHKLAISDKRASSDKRLLMHQNVQLLRELQEASQSGRALAQRLEGARTSVRELSTRYRLVEAKLKGLAEEDAAAGEEAASPAQAATPPLTTDPSFSQPATTPPHLPPASPALAGLHTAGSIGRGAAGGVASSPGLRANGQVPGRSPGQPGSVAISLTPGGSIPRAVGGPTPGGSGVLRGSAARVLHEVLAGEREHIAELLAALADSSQQVERQQALLAQLHSALHTAQAGTEALPTEPQDLQLCTIASGDLAGSEDPPGGPAWRKGAPIALPATRSLLGGGQRGGGRAGAKVLSSRPASAAVGLGLATPVPALSSFQTHAGHHLHGSPVRRRPTSAAGMGLRAFMSSSLKP
ncbi:hypothetical protein QJQ45_021772 [Haematococcus lacustris]|nr:hypothetical protein QJQ45_021772 [Haematococcus lacustris]